MIINCNVTGADRKRLVQTISEFTGADARYLGAPTFAYEVGSLTIDRNGMISGDADPQKLVQVLEKHGFAAEMPIQEEDDEPLGLTVRLPLDKVNVGNLTRILEAKGSLIKKALGIDALPVEIEEDAISFHWFDTLPDPDETEACTHLIAALCEMSRNQKRVTATEKQVENEKYAFRCFLLRLGFIGPEYKTQRSILLRNLSGSSAFKSGHSTGSVR